MKFIKYLKRSVDGNRYLSNGLLFYLNIMGIEEPIAISKNKNKYEFTDVISGILLYISYKDSANSAIEEFKTLIYLKTDSLDRDMHYYRTSCLKNMLVKKGQKRLEILKRRNYV